MKKVWKGEWSAEVAKATTGYTVTVAKNYIWVATFVVARDDGPRPRGDRTPRWGIECIHLREDAALAAKEKVVPFGVWLMSDDTLQSCVQTCLATCIGAEIDRDAAAARKAEKQQCDAEDAAAQKAAVETLHARFGAYGREDAYAELARLRAERDAAQAAYDGLAALLEQADPKRSRRRTEEAA